MSIAGPCDICLTGTVEHRCDRCGNLVCDRHFDETTGFCTECGTDLGPTQPDNTDIYR